MSRFVRIGDRVFNLKYVSVIESRTDDPGHEGGAAIKVNTGQPYYFEGPDGDSVRAVVETFPRNPAGVVTGEGEGPLEYSTRPRPAPDHVRKLE